MPVSAMRLAAMGAAFMVGMRFGRIFTGMIGNLGLGGTR